MTIRTDQLEESKAIQRRTGRTFHVATRLLPDRTRHATYVLYAFFRIADDVVDDPDPLPPAEQIHRLDRLRRVALGQETTDEPVLAAFADVRTRYDIDPADIETFIDAMQRDVTAGTNGNVTVAFADDTELETYLRGSAVAVAYMMLAVMGSDQPSVARPHAKALGEAFQLTNFLRDVREDRDDYSRIYLPETTLERYEVDRDSIIVGDPTPAFRAAVHAELVRAEAKYREGIAGIRYLPRDCQFAVLLAATLYAEHHRLIRKQEFDVLTARPSLSLARTLSVLLRTSWHWALTRDPATVFYRVSPVPRTASHAGQAAARPTSRLRDLRPFQWLH